MVLVTENHDSNSVKRGEGLMSSSEPHHRDAGSSPVQDTHNNGMRELYMKNVTTTQLFWFNIGLFILAQLIWLLTK